MQKTTDSESKTEETPPAAAEQKPPVFLTADEVAAVLRCSARAVYRMADTGRILPPCRFGRILRWNAAAFEAWVASGCPALRSSRQEVKSIVTRAEVRCGIVLSRQTTPRHPRRRAACTAAGCSWPVEKESEITRYLAASMAGIDVDVMGRGGSSTPASVRVWRASHRIARDHLAIPATGAPAECVFSGGADLVTKKRRIVERDSIQTYISLKS